jgi:acyl-CoA synthetase (AMP-forming)/AMP-acid ligase II
MGDTGYFDEAGSFWIVGRVHSTILRGGKYVHPQLVEQAAAESDPQIGRVAAVGLADQELGERVVLVLEAPPSQQLRDIVSKSLDKAGQHVDEIRFSAKPLPLDPRHNAKIDYLRLKESLQD